MSNELALIEPTKQSLAIQIMLNDKLYARTKQIAQNMADARGFTPVHLIGCPEACFAVVLRSLTWKLDPYAVAQSTYQTPSKQVGFEGKLCQAILENSGQLEGGVNFEHYGQWENIQGKFQIKKSQKGNDYPVPSWNPEDENGIGVKVTAKIKGEKEPRIFCFDLKQAFPRNSTLWATDPKTQICYTAVRRFANVVMPGIFMGLPFDREEDLANMRDVTPRKDNNKLKEAFQSNAQDKEEEREAEDAEEKDGLSELLEKAEAKKDMPTKEEDAPRPLVTLEFWDESKSYPDEIDCIRLMSSLGEMDEEKRITFLKSNKVALQQVSTHMRDVDGKPLAAVNIDKYLKQIEG